MTKMYILPGMGADHRMYSGPWERLPNAIFINWPPYRGEISIEAMAQRVMNEYRIEKQSVIIGSSLGGIVACEIAKHCECQKLILIGSAKNPREIHSFLKRLHPLVDLMPIEFVNALAGKINSELTEMLSESDPDFIRAMCKAIFEWKGIHKEIEKKLFRIHGSRDLVISSPERMDLILPGGHLLAMTHAQECIKAISPFLF